MFIRGGFNALTPDDLPTPTGVVARLVEPWIVVAYGIFWLVLGLGLLVGKWFKRRRLHGYSLMGMYLTCIYVLVLSWTINGLEWGQLVAATVGVVSALLYLRWKHVLREMEDETDRRAVPPC